MSKKVIKERPFKVGDAVWTMKEGDGVVLRISWDDYSVICAFDEDPKAHFTAQGVSVSCTRRSLFHLDVAKKQGWVDIEVEVAGCIKLKEGCVYYREESDEYLDYLESPSENHHMFKVNGYDSVNYKTHELTSLRLAKELEGMEKWDNVYSIDSLGLPLEFAIVDATKPYSYIIKHYGIIFTVSNSGCLYSIGGREQLFFRTEYRAKRFGMVKS